MKLLASLLLFVLWIEMSADDCQAENRAVGVSSNSGTASAVVVDNKVLAHTALLLPIDHEGQIVSGDLENQTKQLLANLQEALGSVGTSVEEIARLNIYVARHELVEQVRILLKRELFQKVQPAVTLVISGLPNEKALVAVDAVATVPESEIKKVEYQTGNGAEAEGMSTVSLLPKGRVVYISGMAERTDNLVEAMTGTMRQLHGVLELLGLGAEHVVHVKAFMKPMKEVGEAQNAIKNFYAGQTCPPVSFVEWKNGLPTEIELVAWLPGEAEQGGTVSHRWQPEEKRSPVYCRFAVVDSPVRIYVSGLMSRTVEDSQGQVRDIFSQLEATLGEVGSNLQQMAKATYYVADDEVSKALNEVRPEIYDPQRPPAASKVTVESTGDTERTVVVDMIAVPGN